MHREGLNGLKDLERLISSSALEGLIFHVLSDTESFNLLCESECTEFDSEDNCYLAFPDERLCWYYVVCHQEEYDWISYKMLRCELDAIWSEVNSSCVNMTANMTLPDECLERDNDEVQQLAMAISKLLPYNDGVQQLAMAISKLLLIMTGSSSWLWPSVSYSLLWRDTAAGYSQNLSF